jgi:hypothetical protein
MAITAMCPLLSTGMLCVGSADCCLTVYELANQDVCGRITSFDSIPTAIECFALTDEASEGGSSGGGGEKEGGRAEFKSFIAIGDSKGWFHLIELHNEFGNSTEVGMKKKNQLLFAQSVKVRNASFFVFLSSIVCSFVLALSISSFSPFLLCFDLVRIIIRNFIFILTG